MYLSPYCGSNTVKQLINPHNSTGSYFTDGKPQKLKLTCPKSDKW